MLAQLVPLDNIDLHWDKVAPILSHDRALNNWVTIDSLYTRLKANGADLWILEDYTAALIGATYMRTDGTKTYVVEIMAAQNAKEDWSYTIQSIESQAKEWGCTSIQVRGRKGWKRVLPEYATIQITLERQLC